MILFSPLPSLSVNELQMEIAEIISSVRETKNDKPHDFTSIDTSVLKKSEVLMQFIEENKLSLNFCMGFWCEPLTRGLIHQDLDDWGLNIPIGDIGGYQTWVSVDKDCPVNFTLYGNTNVKKFPLYPDNTPRKTLGKLCLDVPHFVNTQTLHYVDNTENTKLRMVATIRFKETIQPALIGI